jgi:hypothetical protein
MFNFTIDYTNSTFGFDGHTKVTVDQLVHHLYKYVIEFESKSFNKIDFYKRGNIVVSAKESSSAYLMFEILDMIKHRHVNFQSFWDFYLEESGLYEFQNKVREDLFIEYMHQDEPEYFNIERTRISNATKEFMINNSKDQSYYVEKWLWQIPTAQKFHDFPPCKTFYNWISLGKKITSTRW